MSQNYYLSFTENSDVRQQIQMQDEDIGFNWNHFSQTDKPKQKDSVLKDKSQITNNNFMFDDETGEQFNPTSDLQASSSFPGLSDTDGLEIDEYLSFLDQTDLASLDVNPQDFEWDQSQEQVLDTSIPSLNQVNTNANEQFEPSIFSTTYNQNKATWTNNNYNSYNFNEDFAFRSNQQRELSHNTSLGQTSQTHSFDRPEKTINYYPDEDLFQSITASNDVLNTNNNPALMFNVTNAQPNISDTSFNNLRSSDSSNQVLEENNFAMSQLHVDSRQLQNEYPMPGEMFFLPDNDINPRLKDISRSIPPSAAFNNGIPPPPSTNIYHDESSVSSHPPLPPFSFTDIQVKAEPNSQIFNQLNRQENNVNFVVPSGLQAPVKEEKLNESLKRSIINVNHNHTYDGTNGVRKPCKNNRPELNANGTRKSRDEKKAEELEIPFTLDQIVFTPVDDFNEMLSHVTLTSEQQLLIKDIRRRGKNKIAAQNCRKRKVETINFMESDVGLLRKERDELLNQQNILNGQKLRMEEQYIKLQESVFDQINSQRTSINPTTISDLGIFVIKGNYSNIAKETVNNSSKMDQPGPSSSSTRCDLYSRR